MTHDTGTKLNNRNIEELFDSVRNTYYMPPVRGPKIVSVPFNKESQDSITAFINFLDNTVTVNKEFIHSLEQFAPSEQLYKGVFSHEISHYMLYPSTLEALLYLSYHASQSFPQEKEILFPSFLDLMCDTLLIQGDYEKESRSSIINAEFNSENLKRVLPFSAARYLGLETHTGLKFQIDTSVYSKEEQKKIENAVRGLSQLIIRPITSNNPSLGFQYAQFLNYANFMMPLIPKEDSDKRKSLESLIRKSNSMSGSQCISQKDISQLPERQKEKIKQAVKKLTKSIPKKQYDEIKKHFLGPESKSSHRPGKGIGTSSQTEKEADIDTVRYYKDAAEEYGIYIRPKRSRAISTADINFGKREYKVGENPNRIDIRFSGGKILPGLTKKRTTMGIPIPATRETVPALIILKDASGSMDNPMTSKDFATISGAIYILSYRRSGSEVGVSLFDSETSPVFYSKNEEELIKKLCSYKGGGTSLDIGALRKDLEEKRNSFLPFDINITDEEIKKNPLLRNYIKKQAYLNISSVQPEANSGREQSNTDLVIITDGGIANIEEVLDFVKSNKSYRPTIIHTGSFNLDIPEYDQKTSGVYDGITVFKSGSRRDILDFTKKNLEHTLLY